MKRDMDLVRRILLSIESHEHGYAPEDLSIGGYSDEQVGYHVFLLVEAGLLHGFPTNSLRSTSPSAHASRLTWAGHEFLDAARSETIWKRAKERIGSSLGTVSIDVLTALLIHLAKEKLGLSDG